MPVSPCVFTDQRQCDVLITTSKVAGSLSLFGSLFMILSILCWTSQRFFIQRLLLYLMLATLLDTIPYFMEGTTAFLEDKTLCNLQGFWIQFSEWAVLCWIICLTYNLCATIVHQRDTKLLERYYLFACWGIALLAAIIPVATNAFQPSGSWCWLEQDPKWLRFVGYYGEIVAFNVIIGLAYVYLWWYAQMRAQQWRGTYRPEHEEEKRLIRLQAHPLRLYPPIFVLLSLFGVANRLQNALDPDNPLFLLYLLHALTAPLSGFGFFLVYVFCTDLFFGGCTLASLMRALKGRNNAVQVYTTGSAGGPAPLNEAEADSEDEPLLERGPDY